MARLHALNDRIAQKPRADLAADLRFSAVATDEILRG
jgi:hypothetical protein